MQSILSFLKASPLTSHLSLQLSSNEKIIVWVYFLLFGRMHGLCPHVFLRGRCLSSYQKLFLLSVLCVLAFPMPTFTVCFATYLPLH